MRYCNFKQGAYSTRDAARHFIPHFSSILGALFYFFIYLTAMLNIFFWLILIIVLLSHFTGLFLDYLNNKMWSDEVPEKLKGIIDNEKYRRSQQYYRENKKFSNIASSFNLIVVLLMLTLAGFALLDTMSRSFTSNEVIITLIFFGSIGVAKNIMGLPFSWYGIFKIEEKYGFNKTTTRIFITDQLKGLFLSIVIGGPVLAFITWIFYVTGEMFWFYIWIVLILFALFMNMFYSELIVPLFNKQRPLEEGELRDEIEMMAKKAQFKLTDIYTIDGSKRSTRANAYFSGIGKKKRIVLYDTLSNDLTNQEIVAVLAHEIGHYKKRHTRTMLFAGIFQTGLMLYIFSLLSDNIMLSRALGAENTSFHISLLAFILIYSPVSLLISLVMNLISRKFEYEADEFARNAYSGLLLASALKKLSVKNLSNMMPHPLYVFFYYSHPPLIDRLKYLEQTH